MSRSTREAHDSGRSCAAWTCWDRQMQQDPIPDEQYQDQCIGQHEEADPGSHGSLKQLFALWGPLQGLYCTKQCQQEPRPQHLGCPN